MNERSPAPITPDSPKIAATQISAEPGSRYIDLTTEATPERFGPGDRVEDALLRVRAAKRNVEAGITDGDLPDVAFAIVQLLDTAELDLRVALGVAA